MRYLGIDYGSKRIGLAVGDDGIRIAFPREVIQNDPQVLERIKALCQKDKIEAIVLGQSLDYKGQPNEVQSQITKFKSELESVTRLPIYYQSETLTSAEAARSTAKANLDASAAAIILQTYLDRL